MTGQWDKIHVLQIKRKGIIFYKNIKRKGKIVCQRQTLRLAWVIITWVTGWGQLRDGGAGQGGQGVWGSGGPAEDAVIIPATPGTRACTHGMLGFSTHFVASENTHYQRGGAKVSLEERKNKKGQPLKLSKSRGKSLGQSIPGNQEGDELLWLSLTTSDVRETQLWPSSGAAQG